MFTAETAGKYGRANWPNRAAKYGPQGGLPIPSKIQFCPKKHDTFLYGRTKNGNCKMCRAISAKKWRDTHKEQIRLINRKSDLKQYGLTLDSYTELLQKQDSKCAMCKEAKTLVIDHNHITGKVRGLLCIACNIGLGHYENLKEKCDEYLGGTF